MKFLSNAFTLAGGFCGAWQGTSPNAVSEQSGDDCEPAIIQESGFCGGRSEAKSRGIEDIAALAATRSAADVRVKQNPRHGFTLAEVLITLAIIGVVAAIAIPSVISNSQQQEFKTGLKKAVTVLNSAITMNLALDGETPYDNANLYGFLIKHMAIIKTTFRMPYYTITIRNNGQRYSDADNAAFYTTDGMRFEFNISNAGDITETNKLHESNVWACSATHPAIYSSHTPCTGCGSYGLNHNPNNTTKPPCIIMVDVNGDKKPTPGNINCNDSNCAISSNGYKVPLPNEKKVKDIFSILITEDRAIPYGVTAQKAMYNSQK